MPVVININAPQQQILTRYASEYGMSQEEAVQTLFEESLRRLYNELTDKRNNASVAISAAELKSRVKQHLKSKF